MEADELDEPEMTVEEAIAFADSILPGIPVPDGEEDPRYQAIFKVEDFINIHPVPQREAVWDFIVRWGSHPQQDVRDAIACCLLEVLLGCDFKAFFPRVKLRALRDPLFADTFSTCWMFHGDPAHIALFDNLKSIVHELHMEWWEANGIYPWCDHSGVPAE